MLVLSRKPNESIIIDDRIKIVVVEIRGDKVRLGIEAPKEVDVHREEVWLSIRQEQTREEARASESAALAALGVNQLPQAKRGTPISADVAALKVQEELEYLALHGHDVGGEG